MRTKLVGIAVDEWKTLIFIRRLKEAGYMAKDNPGLVENTRLLHVEIPEDQMCSLADTIKNINQECARWRNIS